MQANKKPEETTMKTIITVKIPQGTITMEADAPEGYTPAMRPKDIKALKACFVGYPASELPGLLARSKYADVMTFTPKEETK